MLFNWLRRSVRNAVLSGINDAVEALESDDGTGSEDVTPALRLRLLVTPALPAATEEETPAGKRKRA